MNVLCLKHGDESSEKFPVFLLTRNEQQEAREDTHLLSILRQITEAINFYRTPFATNVILCQRRTKITGCGQERTRVTSDFYSLFYLVLIPEYNQFNKPLDREEAWLGTKTTNNN